MISDSELIELAKSKLNPQRLSPSCEVGGVASALVTEEGDVFVGVCIDTGSSMGFCAEPNAIGNMVTEGQSRIKTIVAVLYDGSILPPCGRCREFIYQIDNNNINTRVILKEGNVLPLADLLPFHEA